MGLKKRIRLFIYGPPGSGKSTLGIEVARALKLNFIDLDQKITENAGLSIPDIFAQEGEPGFRIRESEALKDVLNAGYDIVSLGGGALLNNENLALVNLYGIVICLNAPLDILIARLEKDQNQRPLVEGEMQSRLAELLDRRKEHYASFSNQLNSGELEIDDLVEQAQIIFGRYHVSSGGADYDVCISPGGMKYIGEEIQSRRLNGPVSLVSDENVANFYVQDTEYALQDAGFEVNSIVIPAGEHWKTIDTVEKLWKGFLETGIERGSTVIALGGGVVGDLAGFAAATYKRGIRWVVVPTSLLSMVDASLGGKTGADLPQGKNLVGSFHHPNLVLVDPVTLSTLPMDELRNGMAEVVKHGVISTPLLFELCRQGWSSLERDWQSVISRAISVKIKVIKKDPYEQGERAVLNLGHTLGHALETVSNFSIKHGEAVSIGMVSAARLSESMGIGQSGITETIRETLAGLGLPTEIPNHLDREQLIKAMKVDKKRAEGKTKAVLPVRIGEVEWGVNVNERDFIKNGG